MDSGGQPLVFAGVVVALGVSLTGCSGGSPDSAPSPSVSSFEPSRIEAMVELAYLEQGGDTPKDVTCMEGLDPRTYQCSMEFDFGTINKTILVSPDGTQMQSID